MRLAFILALCLATSLSFAQKVPRQPYVRHQTTDAQGMTVTYYLSDLAPGEPEEIPLVVYVQGSGWSSHFIKSSDGRVLGANGHSTIADIVRGKARLLLVEKPGVDYLEASSEPGGPEAFRKAFTADRWGETVRAAVGKYLKEHPKTPRLLVTGHSEGGLIAAMLATVLEVPATHVAILAGGGPSQLFDLLTLARRGEFFASVSDDPEKRVQHVLAEWDKITKDLGSHEKLFFGHTYQRWFSFLSRSLIEFADLMLAKVMIVQGGEDKAVDPASADALYATLLSGNRRPNYLRIDRADHSFNRSDKPRDFDGWSDVWRQVIAWFLTETPAKTAQNPGPK